MEIKKMTPMVGAEVTGVDLSKPLSNEEFSDLRDAFNQHSVLAIRDQTITPEQHIAFTRRIGEPMIHVLKEALLDGHPEIYKISNLVRDGKAQGRAKAGQYWHSDLSYEATPSMGSIMHVLKIPETGGDTMFASTAAAYEALSDVMKNMLEGLVAEHTFAHAFNTANGNTGSITQQNMTDRPPVTHPVVRLHSETGRKCLFVNPGFTVRIMDMHADESAAILQLLYDHMLKPQFIYRHKWQRNDLIMWDNRALMHFAVADYGDEERHMHRTTIADPAGVTAG